MEYNLDPPKITLYSCHVEQIIKQLGLILLKHSQYFQIMK